MKNLFLFFTFLFSCFLIAQKISSDTLILNSINKNKIFENTEYGYGYLKDVDNKLDKYIGNWKHSNDSLTYSLFIEKHLLKHPRNLNYSRIIQDVLIIRHLITTHDGRIIEDTRLNSPIDSTSLIIGWKFNNDGSYEFYYVDKDKCPSNVLINIKTLAKNQFTFLYKLRDIEYANYFCPDGLVPPNFLLNPITFNKVQ